MAVVLSNLLIGLLYSAGRYIILKTLLDQVVHSLEYFHSAITLYTYQYYNKMKHMFEQGRSKVFTTGQARVNSEHYVIKCVGGR